MKPTSLWNQNCKIFKHGPVLEADWTLTDSASFSPFIAIWVTVSKMTPDMHTERI